MINEEFTATPAQIEKGKAVVAAFAGQCREVFNHYPAVEG